jgi:hypothetical protein
MGLILCVCGHPKVDHIAEDRGEEGAQNVGLKSAYCSRCTKECGWKRVGYVQADD